MALRFVFALHNHQPVGNFDGVFESAYRLSYAPFLELLEQYWEIPFVLHTSGPLMDWLVAHKPEYIERLKRLVARGQVEILGGPYYEPILTMIPSRDRIGQIRSYRHRLEDLLQTDVRGMWVPERVWEQNLIPDIVEAGVEYTALDDYHFTQAGLDQDQLFGYYVSEDSGRVLRIFPGSERMRYLVPFRNPEETEAYFGTIAGRHPEGVIVFADDGEKFGSWPETHKHCFEDRWLMRFLDMLRRVRSWVRLCHFKHILAELPPAGKVYLPDASYREMTEWALPTSGRTSYDRLVRNLENDPRGPEVKRFLRAGSWRNFKVRYPETEEMYGRMMEVSREVEKAEKTGGDGVGPAQRELYQAQCNCPWWHGAFGGLYLPHLRAAVYQHLIAAENEIVRAEHGQRPWVESQSADFDFDGSPEVSLRNDLLAAYFAPHRGGTLYELDVRRIECNLLATLARRPEIYHETIVQHSQGQARAPGQDRVIVKQAGLEQQLQYDPYLRKALIDHFYEPGVTVEHLAALRETELGDFVTGRYEYETDREGDEARLTLRRAGQVDGRSVRITKAVTLRAGADALRFRYVLDGLPRQGPRLHFAVEFNFAGMAAGADDRYFYRENGQRAGQLQTMQNLDSAQQIGLKDEWLGADVSLHLSQPGGIWAFPIQTVSQSEGGYELVHQSTAVLPHWLVEPDSSGRWRVDITLRAAAMKGP